MKSILLRLRTLLTSLLLLSGGQAEAYRSVDDVPNLPAYADDRRVYAHFMVGVVASYTQREWVKDMRLAKRHGIDGFALNVGGDAYTAQQLALAYAAASQVGFTAFLSFDFAAGGQNSIVDLLSTYAVHPAAAKWQGKPIVSNFDQAAASYDWQNLENALAAQGVQTDLAVIGMLAADQAKLPGISGLFNWNAWPTQNNEPISGPLTDGQDVAFETSTQEAGIAYMAAVSPWFSTHFADKNRVYDSGTLLIDRWNMLLSDRVHADLVEVLTWNDYGESSYIGRLHASVPNLYPAGSEGWVANHFHGGFLELNKVYAEAWKRHETGPVIKRNMIIYWYRRRSKAALCSDALPIPTGAELQSDLIFAVALLKSPARFTVSQAGATNETRAQPGMTLLTIPLGVGQPTFKVEIDGEPSFGGQGKASVLGSDIPCTEYDFNAYSGAIKQ